MTKYAPRTRTRLGCFKCRRMKRKCDGARPQCSYCLERGEQCRYGLMASYHPSRQITLSAKDSAALSELEEQRGGSPQPITQFVNQTSQIIQSYQDDLGTALEHIEAYRGSHLGPVVARRQPIVIVDLVALDDVSAQSSISLGSDTSCVATIAQSPDCSPDALNSQSSNHATENTAPSSLTTLSSSHVPSPYPTFVAPAYFDVDLPVPDLEQIRLIRAYLQETGTWCEVTDTARHFTVCYVHPLMRNKPFAAAAMALGSRQLDAVRRSTSETTLSLYQYAVQSLLHYEPSQCGEATLVCCVLLSVYEMMTSDVGEWRRHLKGCVFNLVNKGWNGSSLAIVGAAFWAFTRTDIWAAYLLKETTLVPPESWLTSENRASSAILEDADNYCNLTTLFLAKIVNLQAGGFRHCGDEINILWSNLQAWQSHRPLHMLPILKTGSNRGNPFPTTLYAGDPSIYGNTMYHTGCILLLRTGQVQHQIDDETQDAVWHAKELCGISTTNVSHASWVNQLYPLYIAGQALEVPSDEGNGAEHAAEKIALLKHLAKIERETGWPTASKATALRRLWGLE